MRRSWLAPFLVIGFGVAGTGIESCAADTFTPAEGGVDANNNDSPQVGDAVGPPVDGGGCSCDGGACVDDKCILAMGDTPCMALGASTDAHVYWADARQSGNVYRMTTDGSNQVELIASNQSFPRAIAVDQNSVVWATSTTIMSANLNGGNLTTIQSGMSQRATALTLEGANLYFGVPSGIYVVPKNSSGTTPQLVTTTAGTPAHVAFAQFTAARLLFWTANQPTGDGGAVSEFASLVGDASVSHYLSGVSGTLRGFAVGGNGAFLYAAHTTASEILGGPPIDGGMVTWLQTLAPYDLALDGTEVYWSQTSANGAILKSPSAPSASVIQSGETNPTCIGIDATHVWWVSNSHVVPASAAK